MASAVEYSKSGRGLMMNMKDLYRRIFSQEQRLKFYQWRLRCSQVCTDFGHGMVNCLPCSLKVFLKEHLSVLMPLDYSKAPVVLDISSAIEKKVRTKSCSKEPETVAWMEEFLKEDDVLWDIGANVGAYSLVAATFLNKHIQVYAFEPSFLNYAQLCRNIALNQLGDVITPFNVALSDQTSLEEFNYQNFIVGGAMHTIASKTGTETFKAVFKQKIMGLSIDEMIKLYQLPVPNLIKLDVDGVEFRILKGAYQTLSNNKVRSILVEIDEDKDQNMIAYLTGLKFTIHARFPQGDGHQQLSNVVFKR